MKWYSLKIGSVAHYIEGSLKIQSVKLITLCGEPCGKYFTTDRW